MDKEEAMALALSIAWISLLALNSIFHSTLITIVLLVALVWVIWGAV